MNVAPRCTICHSPLRELIDAKLQQGISFSAIERATIDLGRRYDRETIGRHYSHAKDWFVAERDAAQNKNKRDLAIVVRDKTLEAVESGELQVGDRSWKNVVPGLQAQSLLDRREQKKDTNKTAIEIAMLLSGAVVPGLTEGAGPLLLDEGDLIIEGEMVEVEA